APAGPASPSKPIAPTPSATAIALRIPDSLSLDPPADAPFRDADCSRGAAHPAPPYQVVESAPEVSFETPRRQSAEPKGSDAEPRRRRRDPGDRAPSRSRAGARGCARSCAPSGPQGPVLLRLLQPSCGLLLPGVRCARLRGRP